MAKPGLAAILGLATALVLLAAQPAAAATEVGNKCIGNTSTSEYTLISLANAPGDPLPARAPGGGVVTRWTFNVVPIPSGILSQTLKVFRSTGAPGQFQVVGESTPSPIASGLNTFSTRIPVQAGDFFGISGAPANVFCETGNAGEVIGAIPGNPTTGSPANVAIEANELQLPITAAIEPDADNDGYGDETQDKCPQSAAFQTECPVVTVDLSSAIKKKGSVVVLLTTDSTAPVKVSGTAKLGKGKKAKLSGGTKTVAPGKITRFTLKFTKKLKKKLAELTTKQSLQLKVTASATDLVGRVAKDTLKVKLKGQAHG